MKNKVQLCTYADRFGQGNIAKLHNILKQYFSDAIGGVHLLPFYYPIDGADAGFDPVDHTSVDRRLGEWQDITQLSDDYDIMADMIVNHMSSDSQEFRDFIEKGRASPYAALFLRLDEVFEGGATEEELCKLYRPRPGLPFTKVQHSDGSFSLMWTTFTSKQIDIDVHSTQGKAYLNRIFDVFESGGVKTIRLDAAGYAVKKRGTNCFMLPETYEFIHALTKEARSRGMEVLVEIHAHYSTQLAIAKVADWIYDFALPPLILHALIAQDIKPLVEWLNKVPKNVITVLDTHDGIGIVDVAKDAATGEGLLNNDDIDKLVENIHNNCQGQSREATGAAASNVDLYQVNCSYYHALGKDDNDYLIARAIQFFAPGIPQVYYVGLLAGENDMALLRHTNVGRDINRHYYSEEEIAQHCERPVVQALAELMHLRNNHPAFAEVNAEAFSCELVEDSRLRIVRRSGDASLSLSVNILDKTFCIESKLPSHSISVRAWQDVSIINKKIKT